MSNRLPDDLRAALERFIKDERPDLSLQEAIVYALRDWAVSMGYMKSGPRNGIENAKRKKAPAPFPTPRP
jgi:hypothetical protein